MAHEQYRDCIEACQACANACEHCATACLKDGQVSELARCIELDLECAQICRLAVSSMARGGEYAHAVCQLCADVCDACGEECARHKHAHCQECAEACRRCAEECRRMTLTAQKPARAGEGAHAH